MRIVPVCKDSEAPRALLLLLSLSTTLDYDGSSSVVKRKLTEFRSV